MEANARNLERIFGATIQYQVPLFQRPYVWTPEGNLEPLWEDVLALLARRLSGGKVHPHFMGAVVLEQLAHNTGSIENRQVVDGQQRFTTLQLLLIAARDHARAAKHSKYAERFGSFVENGANFIDSELESFKLWPTNGDRAAFRSVFENGAIQPAVNEGKQPTVESNIFRAYGYFHDRLAEWLTGALDDEETDAHAAPRAESVESRFEALWSVLKSSLQVVVIDLDKDDETQVIFETLNARGEELLPADLIKNLLFRRAVADGADVEKLYAEHWQRLEAPYWREQVVQGRLARPRIDVFIAHYLTMQTREDVKSTHLFNAFKNFVLDSAAAVDQATHTDGESKPLPAAKHIAELAFYADVFARFQSADLTALSTFIRRLEAIDTTTVYPVLLRAYAELMPAKKDEFERLVAILESFLVRRMICGLTPKNYNRLFLDLLKALDTSGDFSAESIRAFFETRTGVSVRFPSDDDVRKAATSLPFYKRLSQPRIRLVLEALDEHAYNVKGEKLPPLPDGLQIEHVMPVSWTEHWPLPAEIDEPLKRLEATATRNATLHMLGNLTLINGVLNPHLSNAAWDIKKPALLEFSRMNLTRYFHSESAIKWNEAAIYVRGEKLAGDIVNIWQR